jgi:glycosyltransferase involved in cell wall biosynthesis
MKFLRKRRQTMASKDRPAVTFFHRKPRAVGNYSVEFIFEDVRKRLAGRIDARVVYSRYESSGLFKRLYNCIQAFMNQSDVNHVTGDINYLGLMLNRRKTIQTILDCVHLKTSSGIKHRVLKYFWLTLPVKKAKFITAISGSTKNEILKYVDCPPDKIKVIYVAISNRFSRVDKTFNKAEPRILQVGTAPNKNIPRLIEALKGIPCILEIIGKYNEEYVKLLSENQVKYEYKSGLSDEEMIERYQAADIIALVSTYEGFGMPILEANATGRVVITSHAYSMPEVAGDAACLVDPYKVQSIRMGFMQVIQDDLYRQTLVGNGFENIKRFDPEKISAEYLNLYNQVIK